LRKAGEREEIAIRETASPIKAGKGKGMEGFRHFKTLLLLTAPRKAGGERRRREIKE